MRQLLTRVFGSRNERLVRGYARAVRAANELEPQIKELSDEALRERTEEFRKRLKEGATLDELLPEAFAVVREAAQRTLKMRHFDVQLIGGITLHKGMISEMRTGEGKTLVATLPAYLNALSGEGVHIVTVNEYLAQRLVTELLDLRLELVGGAHGARIATDEPLIAAAENAGEKLTQGVTR